MGEITVKCTRCDWITDLSTISETNPKRCPRCGAEYVDAYENGWGAHDVRRLPPRDRRG